MRTTKPTRRRHPLLPLLALAGLAAAPTLHALAPATAVVAGSVEAALASIRAEDIEVDLTFIASDELLGRDTPSEGLRTAARYLAKRVEDLGFRPCGEDGGFLDPYGLTRAKVDLKGTRTEVVWKRKKRQLEFGEDYYFYGAAEVQVDAPVLYAGTGTEEELSRIDFRHKAALCLAGGGPGGPRWNPSIWRAEAIVVVPAPGSGGDGGKGAARWAEEEATSGRLRLAGSPRAVPSLYATERGSSHFLHGATPRIGEDLGVRLRHRRKLESGSKVFEVENVAALWPGSDPTLASEVLIVSAHYDHVGVGEGGAIYNGADDNGSGTCGLLALAGALKEHGPLRRSVLLLWVSGEEKGLLGSEAWTRDPTLPEGMRAVADLNIDMIGRNAPDSLLITPTKKHPAYNFLTRLAERLAPSEGFGSLGNADEYWDRSDHANFSRNLGIPVAFLFSDVHADYHQPTDTVDKIDFDKIERVSRLVFRMLVELQSDQLGG